MTAIEWSVHPAIGSLITLPAEWWREDAERRAAALAEEAHLLALDCVGLASFARLCEVEEARIMLDAEMEGLVLPPLMMVSMDPATGSDWTAVCVAGRRHGKTAAMNAAREWWETHHR